MPKRLAIVISGAVSLGAYEAGVLYEVLQAIAAQNASATTDEDKVYVDVMTGASAGAMCTAVLAQRILYDGKSLMDPDSNPLHDPWVVDVSLGGLLDLHANEPSAKSFLSSDLIEAISTKYVLGRYASGNPALAQPHPAIEPGKLFRFGLSLSNLDGVDYSQAIQCGGPPFTYTRYQDEFRRKIDPGVSDTAAYWDDIRQAAVASGAFPFAFRVRDLSRNVSDYSDDPPPGFPQLNMHFAYTDGGVFQNEPLGMAKDFVDEIDAHLDSDDRFYLFVAPGARTSTIASASDLLTGATADYLATGKALVGAIFNQARFHDWIMAEKKNEEIRLFNKRADQLAVALAGNLLSTSLAAQSSDAYLSALQAADKRITTTVLNASRIRLAKQFSADVTLLSATGGAPMVGAWIDSILVLELAAGLGEFDEMNIYSIIATDSELAGSALFAFAGFFDQKIRQHDYDVGRNKAKAFLKALVPTIGGPPCLGPLLYDPGLPIPLDPEYQNFSVTRLSIDERQDLKERILDRLNDLLAEIGCSWILRKVILTFFISGKLNDLLSLNGDDDS